MSGLSSPLRFLPPATPRRAPSPIMSPGMRRGRAMQSSDEAHLRDLSPDTTFRAFTEQPMPFDTGRDEFKIFACVDTLTPAEKDLGMRVAKAAQQLQNWCQEIQQWGWSGSFEPPTLEEREKRRKSLQDRIREHVRDEAAIASMPPLEYWGSLLSVEVESHEARLDDISEELLALDIEELKEHVLDIHGPNKSRPSSAGLDASRHKYTPLDDFSFLITQTLLAALPDHFRIKEKLNTWTARVSVLREAPRYLDHLSTAQKAIRLGWDAIEPPTDTSDEAFDKWKEAVETINQVLQGKVSYLGRRLDRMLDTLEGRDDCLPDNWIDGFEVLEAEFGRWAHDSRRRVLVFDLRRKLPPAKAFLNVAYSPTQARPHSSLDGRMTRPAATHKSMRSASQTALNERARSVAAIRVDAPTPQVVVDGHGDGGDDLHDSADPYSDESFFDEGDTVIHNELDPLDEADEDMLLGVDGQTKSTGRNGAGRPSTPRSRRSSTASISSMVSSSSSPPGVADSPSVRAQAKMPRPELNAVMGKRRGAPAVQELSETDNVPWPPTRFSKQLSGNTGDELDRKISDILETIPTQIRLKSGNNLVGKTSRQGLRSRGSRGALRPARSANGLKTPELTLSRARDGADSAAASGRRSAAAMRGDNDIKLYHLTQPGRERPVKLYIRRVGENGERVMVRVGGGWADLGEYLRQYAEHHGRRAVSDGKFEILGLEVNQTDSPRPESVMSKRDRRASGGYYNSPSTTPQKTPGSGVAIDETIPPVPALISTPGDANDKTSAPSTVSSTHSWAGNEVGLAGPRTKKLDLSGDKLEWVEGMLKQARTVSGPMGSSTTSKPPEPREEASSRSESRTNGRKTDFGDLGRVGGTKRIFLRGGGLGGEH